MTSHDAQWTEDIWGGSDGHGPSKADIESAVVPLGSSAAPSPPSLSLPSSVSLVVAPNTRSPAKERLRRPPRLPP